MLYDNALLISTYTRAWVQVKEPLYQQVVEETIDWLNREMQVDGGVYASAIDADSEGEEGAFYVWDKEQVETILGPFLREALLFDLRNLNGG